MKNKVRLSDVPKEYWEEMFEEIVKVISVENAKTVVAMDIPLSMAFPWMKSKRGHTFWELINDGKESEIPAYLKTTKKWAKEAEKRGFALGVNTELGVVTDTNEHEYNEEEDVFFYHNIKAYYKGKWTTVSKPTSQSTTGGQEDDDILVALKNLIGTLRDIRTCSFS